MHNSHHYILFLFQHHLLHAVEMLGVKVTGVKDKTNPISLPNLNSCKLQLCNIINEAKIYCMVGATGRVQID